MNFRLSVLVLLGLGSVAAVGEEPPYKQLLQGDDRSECHHTFAVMCCWTPSTDLGKQIHRSISNTVNAKKGFIRVFCG
jgi:hypothetical protein